MEQMDDWWNPTWILTEGSFKTTYNQTSVLVDKTEREDIVKSFKKCGRSNALDASENHLIYEVENDDGEEEEEEKGESLNYDFQGF